MKYIHDSNPPVVELSRRNLHALLNKLSAPQSMKMLGSPVSYAGQPEILVKAVENAEHYSDRPPGEIYVYDAFESLIEQLKDQQHKACAYGTREGDDKTCDCKYLRGWYLSDPAVLVGEATGCCELRAAIQILVLMQKKENNK